MNSGSSSRWKFFPEKDSLKKLLLALMALFLYGMTLKHLGFCSPPFIYDIFIKIRNPTKVDNGHYFSLINRCNISYPFQALAESTIASRYFGDIIGDECGIVQSSLSGFPCRV
jgi:hypothetical protein